MTTSAPVPPVAIAPVAVPSADATAKEALARPRVAWQLRPEELQAARILAVDDQLYNIQLLKMMLRGAGFQNLYTTVDSREALPLYVEHQPDLVLLDLSMPHIDGFGVMAQLREHAGADLAPILILTAETDPEMRYRALGGGARDFLNKPFDKVETLARIRNLLEMRLMHNRVRADNEELEQRVRERTSELRDAQMEIIHRLGHAAEYKDNETGNHIIRMSLYCAEMARAVGLPEDAVEMLQRASPMHDVGKIGIPDRVLLKPGKLDAGEWAVMQTHAAIGADLLGGSRSPLIQMAAEIALTHHEKWDGTGYPRGLRGEEIPLVGRICALCDVFDALTSERPYKRAWSVDEAMAEIERGVGRHFDPQLVSVMVAILPRILAIRARYQED
jgi:putative two-component system response regulator